MKIPKAFVGFAGQFFVAGELSRREYVTTMTIGNTPNFDILISTSDGGKQKTIQVKTIQENTKKWPLQEKNEHISDENIFYVFVFLNGLAQPSYHIVPSSVVAEQISTSHREWLAGTSKSGSMRKDNKMRNFLDKNDTYLDNWDALK